MSNGILIAIGGSERKGSTLLEIVKNSKFGTDSNIIIIPTASSYQNEVDSEYRSIFEGIGCKNIKTLPFDFYLPDYNTCIEFHGVQHYKPIPYFGGEENFLLTKQNLPLKSTLINFNFIPVP